MRQSRAAGVAGLAFSFGIAFGFAISLYMRTERLHVTIRNHSPLQNLTLSDEQVNITSVEPAKILHFTENNSMAESSHKKIRLLCWIMTSPKTLKTRAIHVRATWGKRCTILLFVSDFEDRDFPTIPIEPVPSSYVYLPAKTTRAFDYIYKNYYEKADWFLKVDDDTYVIVENLRHMLNTLRTDEAVYLGHRLNVGVREGIHSGGAGYVLSKEALRRFGTRQEGECNKTTGKEDVEIGRCMESLRVNATDSKDERGRSRFHCFNPETQIQGDYPEWYSKYDADGATEKGIESISDYPITFHYIGVKQMYSLEYYIYHLKKHQGS